MPFFLQTQEIKGASKDPAHRQEIELVTFQVISTTEIEIAVSPTETAARNQLQVYFGNQNLRLARAIIRIVFDLPARDSGILLTNVSVTKMSVGANGQPFFTLSSTVNRVRDHADGMPTGKRQHKPMVITKELDRSAPLLYNVLVTNENITEWALKFWTPTILTTTPKK